MNKYERLENEACEDGIDVIDYDFESTNFKGLYIDNTIALSRELKTSVEKNCILAEEMGHHYTTTGDILDQSIVMNRKQEYRARVWAYRKLLKPSDLVRSFRNGCRNRYEIAEYLDVTEEFLEDSLNYFKTQYPQGVVAEKHYIRFIPNLQIITWF